MATKLLRLHETLSNLTDTQWCMMPCCFPKWKLVMTISLNEEQGVTASAIMLFTVFSFDNNPLIDIKCILLNQAL